MLAISLTIACSRYIYNGVILHAHPVRGESHNHCNTTGEVTAGPRPDKKALRVRQSLQLVSKNVHSSHWALTQVCAEFDVVWFFIATKWWLLQVMRCASFTCLSNVHLSIGLHRDCCNLSTAVALNVRFTMNGMCTKNNTHIYVARTRNNRVIMVCNLYCCLLPQCEAFRTCCSDFSTATIQGLQLTEARNILRSQ